MLDKSPLSGPGRGPPSCNRGGGGVQERSKTTPRRKRRIRLDMKDDLAEQDVMWGGGSSVGKSIPESGDGICTGWEREGVCVLLGTRRIVKSLDSCVRAGSAAI